MTLKYLFVFIFCFFEVGGEKNACSKLPNAPEPSTLSILRKKLKCNYDVEKPPINVTNSRLNVQIYMNKRRMEYYGTSEYLISYPVFMLTWRDERLKWNKAEYKNHSYLSLRDTDIWTPQVHSPGFGYLRSPDFLNVLSSGQVVQLFYWVLTGNCRSVYAKWTDERICTMSFYLEPAEKLRLTATILVMGRKTTKKTAWRITQVKRQQNKQAGVTANLTNPIPALKFETDFALITAEVHIQRNTAIMDASLFPPAAVLFLLVLASTWIPCGASIRLAMLALTMLLEIFLINFATKSIPTLPGRFSDYCVLYRDMVLVSGAAYFEWYVSYLVACKKMSSTGRLQSAAGIASQSSYAFLRSILLIPSNPTTVKNGTPEGAFLSVILDRITFLLLFTVFIIIMIITAHRSFPI